MAQSDRTRTRTHIAFERRDDQLMYIGTDIIVKVRNCKRGKCTVVIEAPPDVRILRGELFEKIKQGEAP